MSADTPVAGGVLRLIINAGPQSVGWWATMGPTDEGAIFPGVERTHEVRPRAAHWFPALLRP